MRHHATTAPNVLASATFVTAVGLLVVNDWLLKAMFSSWWTGKLSDVAGLFAFALFWSAFFPRQRRVVVGLIACAFVVWKSPLVDPLLDAWNGIGFWPLSRVVDYTDLWAILVLVPADAVARRLAHRPPPDWARVTRRFAAIAIAVIALGAFAATSKASPVYRFAPHNAYLVASPRGVVRPALDSLGVGRWTARSSVATADTLVGCMDGGDGRWVCLTIELRDAPQCGTALLLMFMEGPYRKPDFRAVRRTFESKVIQPLQSRMGTC